MFGITGAGLAYVAGVCLKALFMFMPTLWAYRARGTLSHIMAQEAHA